MSELKATQYVPWHSHYHIPLRSLEYYTVYYQKMKLTPDDPNVDEEDPKFVLKCGRIFQPKDEGVSREDDGIDEENKLL